MGRLSIQEQRTLDILVTDLRIKLAMLKEHSTGELSGMVVLLTEALLLIERKLN